MCVIKNKLVIYFLFFVIAILLVSNTLNLQKIKSLQYQGRIVGTYSTVDKNEVSSDAIYISVRADNTYCIYRQLQILEEGMYMQQYENIYSLHRNKSLIFFKDKAYYVVDGASIIMMKKISETPMLINVKIS